MDAIQLVQKSSVDESICIGTKEKFAAKKRRRKRRRGRRRTKMKWTSTTKKPQIITSTRSHSNSPINYRQLLLFTLIALVWATSQSVVQPINVGLSKLPPPPPPPLPSPQTSQERLQAVNESSLTSEQVSSASHRKVGGARTSRIYRIRATHVNGKLGPPIKVELADTGQRLEEFGARQVKAPPARSSSSSLAAACNQSSQAVVATDGESVAESNSIAATSQTLRLLAPTSGQQRTSQVLARPRAPLPPPAESRQLGRLREVEETSAGEDFDGRPGQVSLLADQQQQPSGGGGGGGPEDSVLSLIDDFDSKIITNRTKAQLSCDSGEMIVRLNFSEPFKGIVYPDHNRLSACRFFGDGHHNYELRLPLRGCGTRQVAPRIFVNDVIVRFHKTLELEDDETKTLICRYPPPLAAQSVGGGGGHEFDLISSSQVASNGFQSSSSSGGGGQNNNNNNNNNNNINYNHPVGRLGQAHDSSSSELLDNQFNTIRTPPTSGSGGFSAPTKGIATNVYSQQQQQPGTVEVLSENGDSRGVSGGLLLAPPDGKTNDGLSALAGGLRQWNELNKQRKANIIAGPPQTTPGDVQEINGQQSTKTPGLLDRLTSLELLFLVSSLMFLVLLGLGLLGAFYCLRRPSRPERASAILSGRKRRRPGGYLTAAASAGGPAGFHRSPADLTTLRQHHHHHHQQQQQYGRPSSFYPEASQRQLTHHQQHLQHHQTAPSSPESDLSQQVLLPGAFVGLAGAAKQHQHYSTSHQHHHHHHQQQQPQYASNLEHNAGGLAPVLGRRDAATAYGYSSVQRPQPTLGRQSHRHHQHLYQPPAAVGQYQQAGSAREPLLKLASDAGQDNYGVQLERRPPKASARVELHPQHGHLHLNSLNRARSLQQLQEELRPTANMSMATPHHHHLQGWQSLSRPGQPHLNAGEARRSGQARPRQMVKTASSAANLLGPRPLEFRREHRHDWTAGLASTRPHDEQQSSSDSELELNNNNTNTEEDGKRPPRLYLKSIEDSFITNVTEIHEQEYTKRDSMQPLSWAAWRLKQPVASKRTDGHQSESDGDDHRTTEERGGRQSSGGDDDDDQGQSNQARLRSLTELDVNFAKSLLVQSRRGSTKSMGADTDGQQQTSGTGQLEQVSSLANNNPPLAGDNSQVARGASTTPDLVISPEYEVGGKLRLVSSPSSQGSISYV